MNSKSDTALCDQISQTANNHGWSIDNGDGYAEWRQTPTLGQRALFERERETQDGETEYQSFAVEVLAGVITVLQTYTDVQMTMVQLAELLASPFDETCWSDEAIQAVWIKGRIC